MDLSPRNVAIGGLIHTLLITYSVIAVGVFLKLRPEEYPPAPFPEWFRSYGITFYLVPLLWTAYAAYQTSRTDRTTDDVGGAVFGWVVLTVLLLIMALLLTLTAMGAGTLVDLK